MPKPSSSSAELDQLTERQLEVVEGVWLDMSNKAIADKLHCSLSTVKAHLERVRWILGANSRVGLALAWERHRPKGVSRKTIRATDDQGAKVEASI